MIKTSRIDDILNENPWDGKHGRVWYYTLVLDNGDRGEIGTKTRDSYSIGDTLNYTLEETDRGNKFKRATKEQMEAAGIAENNGGGTSHDKGDFGKPPQPTVKNFGGRGSEASFAASYSKDLIIKAMDARNYSHPDDPVSFNQWVEAMLITATKIHTWMKENA